MAGLEKTAGGFFTFYLFIVLSQICMTVFFRTLGSVSRNLDGALRIACVVIVLLIVTSGYLVPYGDQRPWLKWFYWLNPVRYAFSGMMMNEFRRLTMTCGGAHLVPNGPEYRSLRNQVCTLAGAVAGSDEISGKAYLERTFGYAVNDMWLHVGVIVIFIVGLLALNVALDEWISFLAPETRNNSGLRGQASTPHDAEKASGAYNPSAISQSAASLQWKSLNYAVQLDRSSTRQLLYDNSGHCVPGRLLALMGPSGAGKSTLLDVLAQRKKMGTVTGKIQLGGVPFVSSLRQKIGYCEQLDVLDPYQTVRESLQFSSLLRNHSGTPSEERALYVEEMMELLDLHECAHKMIGEFPAGLSVEERKRLSIGIELVAKPELLFLDEPTSGLDSQSALSIIQFLRRLADAGQAIICTIHQPSAALYKHFDDLLLLHKGRTVYEGPTSGVEEYFASNGYRAPENANIAEFMIQTLSRDDDNALTPVDWHESWKKHSRSESKVAHEHTVAGADRLIEVCICRIHI